MDIPRPQAVRRLADVLKERSDFTPQWQVRTETLPSGQITFTGLENPKIGKIERVVISKPDGTPIYDQYHIEEGPADKDGKRSPAQGAIVVPWYIEGREVQVGLITAFRSAPRDLVTGEKGIMSREIPRGIGGITEADTEIAKRQLGEETGKVAIEVVRLGHINPNTAFYSTGSTAFALKVDPAIKSALRPDSKEPIMRSAFEPYSAVRAMIGRDEIICGWSLSALAKFDVYMEGIDLLRQTSA